MAESPKLLRRCRSEDERRSGRRWLQGGRAGRCGVRRVYPEPWRRVDTCLSREWLSLQLIARGTCVELLRYCEDDGLIRTNEKNQLDDLTRIIAAKDGERRLLVRMLTLLVDRGYLQIEDRGIRVVGVRVYPERYGDIETRWSKANYAAVFERDGKRCRYCGSTDSPTVDHVLPRSRGGGDELANLVAACRSCNCRKKDRTPDEAGMVLAPVGAWQ